MKHPVVTLAVLLASAVSLGAQSAKPRERRRVLRSIRGLKVEIGVPPSVRSTPVTGRFYFIVAKSGDREPRLQIGRTGTPFFGRDVEAWRRATSQSSTSDLGTPVASLKICRPADTSSRPSSISYSEFKRADGHTVWMHDDQWKAPALERLAGQSLQPPADGAHRSGDRTDPPLDRPVIGPVTAPADTAFVKRLQIQSPLLTKFWGRPIYLGATVLLPRDYETSTVKYPVLYRQGHFSLGAPLGSKRATSCTRRGCATTVHGRGHAAASCAVNFDDSYGVNSVNVGPYGDAIMQELIPEVERRFRIIGESWARITDGGSTGGSFLAHQIFYPDFYGGVWSYCPDSVTFSDVEGINIYTDENA